MRPHEITDRHATTSSAAWTGPPTSVYIVDDHELIRRGLCDLIRFETDMAVVGDAASVADAVTEIIAKPPDIAVVDIMLTDGTGIDVCRRIHSRHPGVTCLIMTSLDETTALRAAIVSGAIGYVPKVSAGSELIDAIRRARSGVSLFDPTLFAVGHQDLRDICARSSLLNADEQKIIGLVIDGLADHDIADQMHLAEETVSTSVGVIVDKIGLIRARTAMRVPLGAAG